MTDPGNAPLHVVRQRAASCFCRLSHERRTIIDNSELNLVLRVLNRIAHALECIERNQQAVILGAESEYMPLNSLASYEAMLAENKRQVAQEEANLEESTATT